jgi:hypothetical protein
MSNRIYTRFDAVGRTEVLQNRLALLAQESVELKSRAQAIRSASQRLAEQVFRDSHSNAPALEPIDDKTRPRAIPTEGP